MAKISRPPVAQLNNLSRVRGPIARFKTLYVDLIVGTPILPGQTLVFRWESQPLAFSPLDLGTVSISLQLIDEFGNLDPTGVLYKDTLTRTESDKIAKQQFASNIITAPFTDELAKRVYRAGSYKLRLILEGTGQDGPFESDDQTLVVTLPVIDDSWWMWTVPEVQSVDWKKNYSVSGSLTNKTPWTSITAIVTLMESNDPTESIIAEPKPEQNLASTMLSSPIGSGQDVAVTFSQLDLWRQGEARLRFKLFWNDLLCRNLWMASPIP